VGGLAVGEARPRLLEMTELACELLPHDLPRYLMGVGRPLDLVDCVARGIDMFDCVIPTRHARSGLVYTVRGRLRLTDRRYRRDSYPPDTSCDCYTCSRFSRAYLHHLHRVGEVLGGTLCTIHNLAFFQQLMARIRRAVIEARLPALRAELSPYYERTGD
jgi:queuine tRNA-ribosyltransferase